MNNILEEIWKEAIVALSSYYHGICAYGLREITWNCNQMVDVPVESRTKHLPNTSPERYRYTIYPVDTSQQLPS
jgi:hypothetical protein